MTERDPMTITHGEFLAMSPEQQRLVRKAIDDYWREDADAAEAAAAQRDYNEGDLFR
jgi:hypothetical protein